MMHRALASGSAAAPRRIWPRTIMDAACQKRPLPMSTTNRPFMQQGATDQMRCLQQQQQQQQQRWLGSWNHVQKHHNGKGLVPSSSSSPGLSFSTAVNRSALSSSQHQREREEEEGQERATRQGAADDAEYAASSAPRAQYEREKGAEAAAGAGAANAAARARAAGAGVEVGVVSETGAGGGARAGFGADGGVAQGGASIGSSTSAAAAGAAEAASSVAHTVVRHPPTPGWEYPSVPDGCEAKFAVIRLGNTQYKVTKDDVIVAEKLAGDVGTTLDITDVLLVGTHEATMVGRPVVPGATVRLYVEEQTKDKKVVVYKKRRRKSSKTTQGHRREVTLLRVTDILS